MCIIIGALATVTVLAMIILIAVCCICRRISKTKNVKEDDNIQNAAFGEALSRERNYTIPDIESCQVSLEDRRADGDHHYQNVRRYIEPKLHGKTENKDEHIYEAVA